MNPIGLEMLSGFGMPPVEWVSLAADLGCASVSTGLTGLPYETLGFLPFSLRDDPALRREMKAAMTDRGVVIALGEGFTLFPHNKIRDFERDMDIMVELGAIRVNSVSLDPDVARSFDEFAVFAEMATARGLRCTLEMCPALTPDSLETAFAAIAHVGSPNLRLVIDTMHVIRSGAGPDDLAAIGPTLIDYVQLCDVPLVPTNPNYFEEASNERMTPGEGELPLRAILAAVPRDVTVSLEVPQLARAKELGVRAVLEPAVEATRQLLNEVAAEAV